MRIKILKRKKKKGNTQQQQKYKNLTDRNLVVFFLREVNIKHKEHQSYCIYIFIELQILTLQIFIHDIKTRHS